MQNHQLNVRHSNIELLRIVSMMLIITTHIFGHYVHMKGSCWPLPEGHIFYFTMKSISYIAVNMYIVISAYFLCCSKFKSKRIISIWIEVLFYSVTIWLFNYLLTGELGSPKTMIFAFFPILMNQYWFATVFIGLLILSPFLNIAIRAFTKKQLRLLSLVLFLLFCIIPQCISQVSKWLNMGGGVGITWFVTLYIWASYIRLYISKDYIQYNKYKFLFYGLLASIMPEILRMLIIVSTQVIVGHPMGGGFFYGNNMLFPTIATVLLFMYFLTVKISNKTINKIILST